MADSTADASSSSSPIRPGTQDRAANAVVVRAWARVVNVEDQPDIAMSAQAVQELEKKLGRPIDV